MSCSKKRKAQDDLQRRKLPTINEWIVQEVEKFKDVIDPEVDSPEEIAETNDRNSKTVLWDDNPIATLVLGQVVEFCEESLPNDLSEDDVPSNTYLRIRIGDATPRFYCSGSLSNLSSVTRFLSESFVQYYTNPVNEGTMGEAQLDHLMSTQEWSHCLEPTEKCRPYDIAGISVESC